MESIRKVHNIVKRDLITTVCSEFGTNTVAVLDVGCGFGGDLPKWKSCTNIGRLHMCDPNEDSVKEAKSRAKNLEMTEGVKIYVGDIFGGYHRTYDVICYNFSLHYIFANEQLFLGSLKKIRHKMNKGGKLIGCIPDSDKIIMSTPYSDQLGNFVTYADQSTGFGKVGERIKVKLVDTPYYANGSQSEPLAYKDLLVTKLEQLGFRLDTWCPLIENCPSSKITYLYSKFIFTLV